MRYTKNCAIFLAHPICTALYLLFENEVLIFFVFFESALVAFNSVIKAVSFSLLARYKKCSRAVCVCILGDQHKR